LKPQTLPTTTLILPSPQLKREYNWTPQLQKKQIKSFLQLTLKITLPKIDKKLPSSSPTTTLTLAETHALLISTLIEEFGEDIRIYSNQAFKALAYTTTQKYLADPNKYFPRLFNAHATKHNSESPTLTSSIPSHLLPLYKKTIIHKIDTTLPFSTIIRHPDIIHLINTYKIQISNFAWNEEDISITSLGWILHSLPTHQRQDYAQETLRQQIKSSLGPNTKIPKFRLVFSKPSIVVNKKFYSTKAFSIQVRSKDSDRMIKILTKFYAESKHFISYLMKAKPDIFKNTIKKQNQFLQNAHVIPIRSLTPELVFHIKDQLMAIPHTYDFFPSSNTQLGEFRVIVDKSAFKNTRRLIQANLPSWISNSPPDAIKTIAHFNTPPYVTPIPHDSYSSDDESYLNRCASSHATSSSDEVSTTS